MLQYRVLKKELDVYSKIKGMIVKILNIYYKTIKTLNYLQ